MRRFVQALSTGVGLPPTLPRALHDLIAALPDRYNISIRQPAGVLRDVDGRWDVSELQWGLIPAWEKQPSTRYSTQTARLERAATSRMYRKAWEARHCLVPMTGYYKWDRASTPRQPYFIQPSDGNVLFAAGLWERWTDRESPETHLDSFAMLTTNNPAIPAPLVPDGPVFVGARYLEDWMTCGGRRCMRVLRNCVQPELEAYPVSRRVADRRLDSYDLLEPADPAELVGEWGLEEDMLEDDE
ncbi:MAG: SOS response-associated peptidase [Lysobacter sp.]